MKPSIHALWVCAVLSGPALADTALQVNLTGVQHDKGAIRIGLYAEPDTFRKEEKAAAVVQIPATVGTVVARFDALPPGRYAIMAYHDEDGNGALNRRLGMFPTEGYGLSNNPVVLGPPSFADSAFDVGTDAQAINIELRY